MKNIIFIKNKTSFVVFTISCILIVFIAIIQSRQSKVKSQKFEIIQFELKSKLDSIKIIQNEIVFYDSLNKLNKRIEILDTIFSDTNTHTKSANSTDLVAKLDSLNMAIITIQEKKDKYIKSFDSLSPRYPFMFRDSIQIEFDDVKNELIESLQYNIDRFNSEIFLNEIFKYLISCLFFILFPLRWAFQWIYRSRNNKEY